MLKRYLLAGAILAPWGLLYGVVVVYAHLEHWGIAIFLLGAGLLSVRWSLRRVERLGDKLVLVQPGSSGTLLTAGVHMHALENQVLILRFGSVQSTLTEWIQVEESGTAVSDVIGVHFVATELPGYGKAEQISASASRAYELTPALAS